MAREGLSKDTGAETLREGSTCSLEDANPPVRGQSDCRGRLPPSVGAVPGGYPGGMDTRGKQQGHAQVSSEVEGFGVFLLCLSGNELD